MVVRIDYDNEHLDPVFEAAFSAWLKEQIAQSKGARRRRLEAGLGYAEKQFLLRVWWPAFRSFQYLHAEYEVYDFKDGTRFLDFAYIRPDWKLCIEIDPFGTHKRDLDRWQHSDNLDRQNDLVIDDWTVLRFSLDKIKEKPRQIQQTLQHALGKWGRTQQPRWPTDDPIDRAILDSLRGRTEPVTPAVIAREIGWSGSTVSRHLCRLAEAKLVLPAGGGTSRVSKYILHPDNPVAK